ncbi:MAG: phosphoadenylyl-sulfate reductase [Pseudomonadota bacterium]
MSRPGSQISHFSELQSKSEVSDQSDIQDLIMSLGLLEGPDLLDPVINTIFKNKIAVSSSFGAESAILLHMVAQIDPSTPVLFIDTGKLFSETLQYRDNLAAQLGLTNIQIIQPTKAEIDTQDPEGNLWHANPDACCHFRKVQPFEEALSSYSAVITGRKRYQATSREKIDVIEHDGNMFKINPAARWTVQDIQDYMKQYNLPTHPLVDKGYFSIGCVPCTTPVKAGEDLRSGRWRGVDKVECGIHFVNGRIVRPNQAVA